MSDMFVIILAAAPICRVGYVVVRGALVHTHAIPCTVHTHLTEEPDFGGRLHLCRLAVAASRSYRASKQPFAWRRKRGDRGYFILDGPDVVPLGRRCRGRGVADRGHLVRGRLHASVSLLRQPAIFEAPGVLSEVVENGRFRTMVVCRGLLDRLKFAGSSVPFTRSFTCVRSDLLVCNNSDLLRVVICNPPKQSAQTSNSLADR
jgi:hypothetical protein